MTHEELAAKHRHPPSPVYINIDRHSDPAIDRHQETFIDRQTPVPIDRREPITYRVQMPKIDDARLNALRPKPKPSENPPEIVRTPSDDGVDPMEVDRVPTGRTLRKRKEKVAKHLKRRANEKEKEKESFRKRVFRISLDKPFDEAYFTHRFGKGREAARRRFRSSESDGFRQIALVSIDANPRTSVDRSHPKPIDILSWTSIDNTYRFTAYCKAVRIMTHEELAAKHPHPPSPIYINIDRHSDPAIDRHQETVIDRQPPAPIDRREPITYRVQMPKIDDARLNALRPKPKPSENPPEIVRTPSDDGVDPMEVDRVPTGRTLRKRKEKVVKQLKRDANEKEKESFRKTVFRISLDKPFDEAYFTHRLWMFFRETRETEEHIMRIFLKGIEFPHALCDTGTSVSILPGVMADHLGLQVELSKELFTFVDCSQRNLGGIVRDLEVQIGNALVPVDFHVLDIKLNWNSSLPLGRAFLSKVGAVCNLQTNQLCLTLIDPHVHYNPIPVKKPQTTPRRINDPGIIVACHCGAEYETEYSA
ncbi:hypothetical protein F2Q69_00059459 [Brassica cretica]|uniref:Aspartic peptidase DDI1-type domain-containing protein n=1 Tax=Brassica cretica TaxID=69181 RepID=A0A8S9RIV9_BRACR|nr:hypothetical protein F2Q69_00059459 [Brassica cretica]